MDGLTTHRGSGVGILLVSSPGDEIQVTEQLCFKTSNNKAEYEALLAYLQAAKYVGTIRIIIDFDSQLMARQLEDVYEIKND